MQAARYPNVASIVMHHALLKALGKHNLAMDKHQQQLLAAGELQRQELLPELSYEELTVRAITGSSWRLRGGWCFYTRPVISVQRLLCCNSTPPARLPAMLSTVAVLCGSDPHCSS